MPQRIDDKWDSHVMNLDSEVVQKEVAKGMLFNVLLEYEAQRRVTSKDVALCIKPTGLRAMRDMKKGELVLVPSVANPTCITTSARGATTDIPCEVRLAEGKRFTFYVNKPSQPTKPF